MPENEKCWAGVQIANHYPGPVPMSALADVQGQDIPLCDMHWSWWIARWLNSDDESGVSAHVINLPDPLRVHQNRGL